VISGIRFLKLFESQYWNGQLKNRSRCNFLVRVGHFLERGPDSDPEIRALA
jgi:hypothetical protein